VVSEVGRSTRGTAAPGSRAGYEASHGSARASGRRNAADKPASRDRRVRCLAATRRLAGVTTPPPDPHALLETQTEPFYVGNRTRSTALLAWFIETVMRLDPTDVEDAICDGGGDKGIDGIVFDEDANEIFVLQAKHRQNAATTQGDADLQRFLGVVPYFDGAEGVAALLASSPNAEVVALVERLGLAERLASSSPTVRLVFVTNAPRDAAARDYLATVEEQSPTIDLWDRDRLTEVAVRTARRELLAGKYVLHDIGDVLRADLTGAAQIALALVPATELVRLPGIENLTIFDLNVRLGLGNTKLRCTHRALIAVGRRRRRSRHTRERARLERPCSRRSCRVREPAGQPCLKRSRSSGTRLTIPTSRALDGATDHGDRGCPGVGTRARRAA